MTARRWLSATLSALLLAASTSLDNLAKYDASDRATADVAARWHRVEWHKSHVRREIADDVLFGDGIEIGAKASPLFKAPRRDLRVLLVDMVDTEALAEK